MNREKDSVRIANKVSDVFNPYYASAPFFLVVALVATRSIIRGLLYWLILALFLSFLPMWDINRRIKRGMVADAHISRREDRIKPFLFSLGAAVAGLIAAYAFGMPTLIKAVVWAVVLTGAGITIITRFWKVSLHAAGITPITVVLLIMFGWYALPAILLVPLVYWARLVLKKHSLAQLIVGSLVSGGITVTVFRAFNLI
ncbi:MAG TPA: hypothetical protein VGK02_10665 [Candidatus Aquicultor sp.]